MYLYEIYQFWPMKDSKLVILNPGLGGLSQTDFFPELKKWKISPNFFGNIRNQQEIILHTINVFHSLYFSHYSNSLGQPYVQGHLSRMCSFFVRIFRTSTSILWGYRILWCTYLYLLSHTGMHVLTSHQSYRRH